jgi:hypothetical protein
MLVSCLQVDPVNCQFKNLTVNNLQNGKTKFTIENATKTRVVLADTKIHILGSYQVSWRQCIAWEAAACQKLACSVLSLASTALTLILIGCRASAWRATPSAA